VITAWRISSAQYAAGGFSGEGARLYGGRWNSPGARLVYTSATVSLATLELVVRVPRSGRLPAYVIMGCSFPETLMQSLDRARLPENWRSYPSPPPLQKLGDQWLLSRSSAVLEVPSAITDSESNYLLNPAHDDFQSIEIAEPKPFRLDLRLLS
jgi:RES domain-containing protein